MSATAVMIDHRLDLSSVADKMLKAATRFWFVVTVLGQLAFAFAVASFYGMTSLRGDYHKWNFTNGFVPGLSMGNTAVVMHLVSAVIIMLSGAVQLVPAVRAKFPVFHRWNGRMYMLAAIALSAAGVYMHLVRGSVGGPVNHFAGTVNAILIWVCAGFALGSAMARDFRTHRRWALRLFLVVSASWFLRIGFFLSFLIAGRPFGFDPTTLEGPFFTFMSFGQYLVPLAVLELYFRAQARPGAPRRIAMAVTLFALTLAMAAGLFGVGAAIWAPQVKAAFDPRTSIAETLSATITTRGIDAAEKQYRDLKLARPVNYNFEEDELNSLGYRLLRANKFEAAIRIFQLNIEAYPKSSNVYDSLGEAYMDAGNKPLAIANYEKSLELNPKNSNGAKMLGKLKAR
ncbi:MAG TPA: DUF2306 domain-containing protein [Terriglobales bacterium]|nr:DUF2306 domain-containing protein [Terriglobales bacterium]